jgi:L-threonylcarbamoyladenylate synthase
MIGTSLDEATRLLRRGELVAIPTETVYGLAGNAYLPEAVSAIFRAKNRPQFDPLILHAASPARISELVSAFPPEAQALADAFWPGPLTLVLPRAAHIHDLVTSGLDTVAVRVPAHPLALALLAGLDFPLAAPSANPFGYISPTSAQHVEAQLGGRISYILDGGACRVGLESTIVGFPEGRPTVLRKGGISLERLRAVVPGLQVAAVSSSRPQAPGMLDRHYSPRVPMRLGHIGTLLDQALAEGHAPAVLSFSQAYPVPEGRQWVLSASGNFAEAAQRLFEGMRTLDASGASVILAELLPEQDLGTAINDRLRRAASPEA